ncbi:C3a anaphylatoxin chemotactic receptor-like [Pristis pectinata]|uniref:C3a anaphylatoxin chemotactic receptor-like n=1 Tax=Pristis pectinata TaxID=685728 RepID=UPI00223DA394|nr:C3a anaphylatoxin chemotactic receptor-like [Pristis pectinata]
MSLSDDLSKSTLGGNFSFNASTSEDSTITWTAPSILAMIIHVLTFLLGVPGNGAVIWVTGFKMKRNINTVCFLNLAVADLTYCLSLPFQMANVKLQVSWDKNFVLWIFFQSAIILNMSASVFLLTLISFCRYLAVTRPTWFRHHLSLSWVRAACFGAWGLAFVMCLPTMLVKQIVPYFQDKTWAVLQITWVVFIFILPIVIMTACYLLICGELHGKKLAKSNKHVRLTMTVVAVFIISWFPYQACGLVRAFSNPPALIWCKIAFSLSSFNSALNPLLYVFTGRNFRQVFRRSLAASLRLAFAEEDQT